MCGVGGGERVVMKVEMCMRCEAHSPSAAIELYYVMFLCGLCMYIVAGGIVCRLASAVVACDFQPKNH